ncbi:hypothetical protein KUTeg_012361 [Tegillarca granosa]|uniref:Arf-GAP domain-containing protein n=1 Tax=Tegillarca granosa TaxID=220873 RepID=A0ABQ9F2S3_TEGGR|nr:hypothetical protein KUTeg_012361 [Tegillarca granosa]
MASSKRKQDEKHLKMLREMAALTHNKHCFDCHQRGPTYVNMTIGSYVCTSCSGILRGLNPPHRVKSISMASFTPEEMDFLKSSGNEFCRKTWLGLYDNRSGMEPDSRDEQKVKDFMSQKYERKRFYVAPTDALKEEARRMNESPADKPAQTRPLKSLLGSNTPSLVVQNNQSPQQTPKAAGAHPPPVVAPQSKDSTPSSFPSPGQTSQSSQSSGSATIDLLGDLGGDPFGSSAPAPAPAPAPVNIGGGGAGTGGGFADFSSFNQFPPPTHPNPVFPTASNPLVPMSSSASSNGASLGGITTATPPAAANTIPAGDNKYSNLADLFSSPGPDQTGSSNSGTSVNWVGGGGGGGAGGGGGSSTGINWGGGSGGISNSSSGTDTGINWSGTTSSSGGGGGLGAGSGGINWGGTPNTSSASIPKVLFKHQANREIRFSASVNPFGGGGTTVQTHSTVGGANPFASAQPMFGHTASSGFGQPAPAAGGFGAQPTGASFGQPAAGAGGFGQPVSAVGGFGQSASAGGFGAGGFGQPVSTAGFGQPAGAFGQPPSTGAFSQPGNFGQPSQSVAGGFGQFGGTPQASGSFGQFGVQNGGFGGGQGQFDNKMASSAGGFGQQGFGTPAPGGWGQPAAPQAANPFMSAAQAPIQPKKLEVDNVVEILFLFFYFFFSYNFFFHCNEFLLHKRVNVKILLWNEKQKQKMLLLYELVNADHFCRMMIFCLVNLFLFARDYKFSIFHAKLNFNLLLFFLFYFFFYVIMRKSNFMLQFQHNDIFNRSYLIFNCSQTGVNFLIVPNL